MSWWLPVEQRLNERIKRCENSCWEWQGSLTLGYGLMMIKGKRYVVHRLAYELWKGPIPEGLTLDHLCRNRACVNPDHLEPVSLKENILRGVSPSADNARKTHCPKGHEFTPDNLVADNANRRRCKTCHRERQRRVYANA